MSRKMLLLVWVALCACVKDVPYDPWGPNPGTILISPAQIQFTETAIGAKQTKTLTITNTTSGPLFIEGLELEGDDELGFGNTSDTDAILKQGELLEVEIVWTPTDNVPDEATITITTNDPQNPVVELPVTTP